MALLKTSNWEEYARLAQTRSEITKDMTKYDYKKTTAIRVLIDSDDLEEDCEIACGSGAGRSWPSPSEPEPGQKGDRRL